MVAPKVYDYYNPTYKYFYIYKIIIQNVNLLSKHSELDQTGDNTGWETSLPGKKVSGVIFRVQVKPGAINGCQIVWVCDCRMVHTYAYINSNKLHMKSQSWGTIGMV